MKKIPDNAKKVFEGVIFDVYHWEQEMFDGSTATFEAIKKRDTVVVVPTSEGKIIVNDEEQPGRPTFISLPGGMCEKESTDPLLEIKRELAEETGYTTDDWKLLFVADPLGHHKIEWNNHFYIAKNCKQTVTPHLDPGEKIQTRLITLEEFLELRNNPRFRNKDLIPYLEKAASSEEEKQTLQALLGITP